MHNISPMLQRLPAIDAARGLVMVLMTVDHASYAFNAGRYVTDSAAWYIPGSTIPVVQFPVRWMTHLCAPTFIFLAGLVLAFSIARKHAKGVPDRQIDIDLLVRGLIILLLDPLWMSMGFGGRVVFQVLYAIGGGLCCMVVLRRLGVTSLLIIGSLLLLGSEALAGLAVRLGDGREAGFIGTFLVTGGRLGEFGYVMYPLLPWSAFMMLGLGCGRLFIRRPVQHTPQWLTPAGIGLVGLYVLVRGINGYGNMLLYRDDLSLMQWLHVSKYPPSLSFALMTLGMAALVLSLFFRVYDNRRYHTTDPLPVFGRVPLFFYLLHVHLLSGTAKLLDVWKKGGLSETFIAAGLVLLVLYPLCRWYAKIKEKRPTSLLKYI